MGRQGCRHRLMHRFRIMAFHEIGRPSVTAEQLFQFLTGESGKKVGLAIL